MSSVPLTKEQKLAISVLQQHSQHFEKLLDNTQFLKKNGPLLKTNFMAASHFRFKKATFPAQYFWFWNQSNTKIQVKLDAVTTVTFRKFSTNKKASSTVVAPSFKIWLFEVDWRTSAPRFFLWCEKGVAEQEQSTQGVLTDIGMIFPETLSVSALAFLRPFVAENVADELGW